jgi:hypothetical protein
MALFKAIQSLHSSANRCKQSGWNPVGTPQAVAEGDRAGLRLAYVRGPDGVTLEFLQPSVGAR